MLLVLLGRGWNRGGGISAPSPPHTPRHAGAATGPKGVPRAQRTTAQAAGGQRRTERGEAVRSEERVQGRRATRRAGGRSRRRQNPLPQARRSGAKPQARTGDFASMARRRCRRPRPRAVGSEADGAATDQAASRGMSGSAAPPRECPAALRSVPLATVDRGVTMVPARRPSGAPAIGTTCEAGPVAGCDGRHAGRPSERTTGRPIRRPSPRHGRPRRRRLGSAGTTPPEGVARRQVGRGAASSPWRTTSEDEDSPALAER